MWHKGTEKPADYNSGKQYLLKFRSGNYQTAIYAPCSYGDWMENNGSREPYDEEPEYWCEIEGPTV